MTSTKTSIGGIPLASFVFNASGPNDVTLEELQIIGASGASAIVMKTCTMEPRQGNEEPRYIDLPLGSINSMGLPNLGYKKYIDFSVTLQSFGKPVIASLVGMSPKDIPIIADAFNASDAQMLELNLSCPNLKGKPQIAYDIEMTDQILREVFSVVKKPLGLKLPPYFDPIHWEQMATVLKKYPISFLSCINSVGNTLIVDGEKESPVIKPKGGFGGLGGAYIKPVALANVRAFSQLLGDRMSIIGVGGILTGMDAFEFLLCGADAVQVGTQFMKEGPGCFARIDQELSEILQRKGYKSIAEAKGKLKVL